MGKGGEHDVRTGTLDFMASEVERQKYLYLPDDEEIFEFFYHNSLHELESVWWLVTWCLFFHRPFTKAPFEDMEGQKKALDALFPRQLDNTKRLELFSKERHFHNVVQHLHSDLRNIGTEVEELRIGLKAAYKSFEARLLEQDALVHVQNFSQNRLNDIHSVFISKFKEIWTKQRKLS